MKIRRLLAPFLVLVLVTAGIAAQEKRLTLEQVSGRGEPSVSFSGTTPRWSWAPDGAHLVRGRGKDARWVDPETWKESEPPRPEANEKEKDGGEAALTKALEHLGVGGKTKRRDLGIELPDLSPDERFLAFVQANDLKLVDVATGDVRAITTNGDENRFNGILDWVYQEEVYGRGDFKAFWWGPDSKHVAFLSLDESDVFDFTVVDHIEKGTFRVKPEVTKYPKSGDPNPTVRLGVVSTDTSRTAWVDLSKYAEDVLVVRVGWNPKGDRAVFMVQDRIQTWLDLNHADPATGEVTTLFRETSEAWTHRPPPPRWLDDGTFLWVSDRTGYRHVYHYRADGTLIRPLTEGEWSVGRIAHVDEEAGRMWFSATKDGAVNGNTYRVGLDGRGLVRLTSGDGSHSVDFDDARTMFLDTFSSLATPTRVRLCDADGKVLKELGRAEIPDRDEYLTSDWELHEIAARDGFPLDVAVLKPAPFDESRAYPVWLTTYSGPDAPTVRNRWNGSAWYQFLAQEGVVVLMCNVRSASGKGLFATATCYEQLGVQELLDLEDAVAWLCANPWADAERVGITGNSYGGFMTAFAMTHSEAFAFGHASSGVYDWGMYDTIYTERYMSTPQLNPEGYAKTSVIGAAEDLSGHLLITHGVMDDNVHVQNAMQLAHALQKAGKTFDLMLYPQNRHGIRDADQRWHKRMLEWEAIREHLIEGKPSPNVRRPVSEASSEAGEAPAKAGGSD